jgi:hypothetical protein
MLSDGKSSAKKVMEQYFDLNLGHMVHMTNVGGCNLILMISNNLL